MKMNRQMRRTIRGAGDKVAPRITGADILEKGDVKINFSAPHGATEGTAFEGAGKMHTVIKVHNALSFTARPVKKPGFLDRLKLAATIVRGVPEKRA